MNKEELFSKIQKSIVELDEEAITKLTDEALAKRLDPIEVIDEAYTTGIQQVGRLFQAGEMFLPEMMFAADLVREAVSKIERLLPRGKMTRKGKIVIGTVAGDIHDIGKNLVISWLSVQGFEVVDIGVDCPADKFIDSAIEEGADIVGASSLLTMTAPEQKKLIDRMKERNVRERFKVLVGGAAINNLFAKEIGADGYGADMKEAADVVLSLLAERKAI